MAEQQNINLGSIQAPYVEQIITLQAGERRKFDYVHNCFSLLDSSDKLTVNFGGNGVDTIYTAGMYYELTEPVPYVIFANNNAQAITIHFALGIGIIKDNRLTVSGIISVTQNPYASFTADTVTIASGTATIAVAKHTVIQNTGTNLMYIGGTGTNGLQLHPNGTFDFSCSATVTVYGTNGDTIAVGSFN